MLSALSRTVKLKLASKLTNAVLEEEVADQTPHYRKARVIRRASTAPTDKELEKRFAHLDMPTHPQDDFSCKDIIQANSGKTIKPIEKLL